MTLATLDAPQAATAQPLLRVQNLSVHFPIHKGLLRRQVGAVQAVDEVDFDVRKGETLGLVGESGCGKSTTGRAVLRLAPITSGRVILDGEDITHVEGETLRQRRRKM